MPLPKSGWGKQEQVGIAEGCHISLLYMSNRLCTSTNANTSTNTFENTNTIEKIWKYKFKYKGKGVWNKKQCPCLNLHFIHCAWLRVVTNTNIKGSLWIEQKHFLSTDDKMTVFYGHTVFNCRSHYFRLPTHQLCKSYISILALYR